MSDDVKKFFKYESVDDAIIGGLLNENLMISKRRSPKNSNTEFYYTLSDDVGVIKIFTDEEEMVELISKLQDVVEEKYDFVGKVQAGPGYSANNG